jgi:DNA-binding MarR family transcriptional regulator
MLNSSPRWFPTPMTDANDDLDDDDYQRLLDFRTGLRRFERWSGQMAQDAGLTPVQHQLLLAIRGHPDAQGPTITDVAEYLQIQHNSVVGLVDRAVAAGLCRREASDVDARVIRLSLTTMGSQRLRSLSRAHVEELSRFRPQLQRLWGGLRDTPNRSTKEP